MKPESKFVEHTTPTDEFFDTQDFPGQVYKFRDWSVEYHRAILEGKFYFSTPSQFNDPFDCKIPVAYELLQGNPALQQEYFTDAVRRLKLELNEQQKRNEVQRLIQEGRFNDAAWLRQAKDMRLTLFEQFGVYCFSQHKTDILLWSHYTNSHKGICIGFDAKALFKTMLKEHNIGGGYVTYVEDYPKISPMASAAEQFMTSLSFKSHGWRYEQEIRLFKLFSGGKIFEVPTALITEITLGCKISDQHRQEIIEYRNAKLPHVKLYQANMAHGKFELDFTLL